MIELQVFSLLLRCTDVERTFYVRALELCNSTKKLGQSKEQARVLHCADGDREMCVVGW